MPLNAQQSTSRTWLNAPLAIVGMACRLPGADGLEQYWELLRSGGYPIERMSDTKLDRELYFHSEKGQRGKTYAEIGGFVTERELDWSLLNISRDDARNWDACHLNFCEVAARACVHAGYDPRAMANRNVGVFVGHSGGTTLGGELAYHALAQEYVALLDSIPAWQQLGSEALKQQLLAMMIAQRPQRRNGQPWVDASYAAGVVSRLLGLTGPHMSIDAACASSLVAMALGAMSIHSGQTDMAIIGGASFNKTDSLILFSHAQSCSSSASRPFDEHADGLISSEGYVALVIKSLDRAQADGDTIQAVIHGIGIATDGRGKSLWAPRKEGQYAAIERAYSNDVPPDSIQMVEAHATSTHLGDATEMEALATFYGQHLPAHKKLPVGSVKSNIGHTLETAGLAGVVKSVLAIQHGIIPPSINVEQPSRSIPWSEIPLRIADHAETWPTLAEGQPRRAAVNAFGIGGLNVHVVVEQVARLWTSNPISGEIGYGKTVAAARSTGTATVPTLEPIAIIGRGCVLPGALDIAHFEQLLQSSVGSTSSQTRHTIDDFHYDWRKHKVPPKQIAQANPLQFMLLEAAEQALREAGLLERQFDRRHTAVVVGSVFGGDFGNALYAGLRLPEFRQRLLQLVTTRGAAAEQAAKLADDYETLFLKTYPALLDETGSFTSSTLASRLSKTFDLMGGALAIDAGDCSGFAALNAACQLLHSGTVKMVLCAAAQRALDRAAMQNLSQCGRLPGTGHSGEGYAIGEGVVLVLLKPLSAARRDGDRVLATIDAMGVGFDGNSLSASMEAATRRLGQALGSHTLVKRSLGNYSVLGGVGIARLDDALQQVTSLRGYEETVEQNHLQLSPNLPLTGHLQSAQGLVDLIGVSFAPKPYATFIAAHAQSGQSYLIAASYGDTADVQREVNPSQMNKSPVPARHDALPVRIINNGVITSNFISPETTFSDAATTPTRIYRFVASTLEQLKEHLSQVASSPEAHQRIGVEHFSESPAWRAAIVCQENELPDRSRKLSLLVGNPRSLSTAIDQGLLWRAPAAENSPRAKVAWLFPGQGSQYQGMLQALCRHDRVAAQALAEADAALAALDQPSFEQLAWNSVNELGENVWHTQAAMLVADWVMLQSLSGRGLRCDFLSGHSFGELPAMLAAGCWSLIDALRATWERCRSIVEHGPSGCAMLSVQADATRVNQTILDCHLALTISHRNATNQTVVGGRQAHIAQLAARLEEEGLVSRLLPVPTAFHTPALDAAVDPFRAALQAIEIHPPRTPMLSSVDNRFIAEPDDIRDGLARQLSTPLDFVGLVERLEREGVRLVIEVGPQQVLTRLVRQTSDQLLIVPSDHAKLGASHQLRIVEALAELHEPGILSQVPISREMATTNTLGTPSQSVANGRAKPRPAQSLPILEFDATQSRKMRLRNESQTGSGASFRPAAQPTSTAPLHYDATQLRRTNHRDRSAMVAPAELARSTRSPQSADQCVSHFEVPPSDLGEQTAIETFLIDFVVEQTGYPAEIIELDWDLEADLGIDSIKKAQLFGELREFFDLESHQGLKLDSYRSLREIAALLHTTPGKSEWLNGSHIESSPIESDVSLAAPLTTLASGLQSAEELSAFLVDFVVEQTGYPPEIIELDADLEADLGIDSIKKAQLFGELRELFAFDPAAMSERASTTSGERSTGIAEFRTLRHILDLLLAQQTPPVEITIAATNEPEMATRSVGAHGELPRLDLALASDAAPVKYVRGVNANLRAMVARRDATELSPLPTNGHWSDYQARLQRFADCCHVPLTSLRALDRTLLTAVNWRALGTAQRRATHALANHNSSHNTDDVRWLAAFVVPTWLAELGTPLGMTNSVDGQVELATPGSVTPLAVLVENSLRVASFSGLSTAEGIQQLSSALLALRGNDVETLLSQIRRWEIVGDWWIMIAHSDRQTLATIESRAGVIAVRTEALSELPRLSTTEAQAAHASSVALLGVDRNSAKFVVHCQQQSALYEPLNMDLPRATEKRDNNSRSDSRELATHTRLGHGELEEQTTFGTEERVVGASTIANRYILRMVPAPQASAPGRQPEWSGTALVIGDNPVARQLEARLIGAQVDVVRWSASVDSNELSRRFVALTQDRVVPHLFLLTPCDEEAQFSLAPETWSARKQQGILGNFWLCQKWFEHISTHRLADDASLMAVSTLGGDFGISGHIYSAEGGGVGGLLKSILIESWMQGYRSLPIKTIDTAPQQSPAEIVETLWRELAIPSYDNEIAIIDGNRHVVRAIPRPLRNNHKTSAATQLKKISRGGTWVCTGGARGITAFVTEKLAQRYGLKLHLLGTAPAPTIDATWRELDEAQLRQLKVHIMTSARTAGRNPVKTWQDTEKALEIDATLRRLNQLGIEAYYHSCDCADRSAVAATLQKVRQKSGPIRGVLHGAGVGKDSRFDRKQPEKVAQCIAAKVDGALALMAATADDPLECFVGFGSISGRFGANGHTDYSLANDMLCKTIDWLRGARPEVRAIGFHWHAWGDVGMATKPETRLALEMIDMQFMPAEEGFEHLVAELEGGAGESEVLITDDRYYRMFYPAETILLGKPASSTENAMVASLVQLRVSDHSQVNGAANRQLYVSRVNPAKDPFLAEHLLDNRPLLPFVVAAEMLLEAGQHQLANHAVELRDIQATAALRFFHDSPQELRIETNKSSEGQIDCRLLSDFIARDGRIVDPNRVNFTAQVVASEPLLNGSPNYLTRNNLTRIRLASSAIQQAVRYPALGSKFYVGWPLQRLKKVSLVEGGIVGNISAPALIELAGGSRDVRGWRIPSAALDACLFAVGVLAWQQVAPGSALPVRIGQLRLGRLPTPGEACQVHAQLTGSGDCKATFNFTLYGVDGSLLVNVVDYEVAWLASEQTAQQSAFDTYRAEPSTAPRSAGRG